MTCCPASGRSVSVWGVCGSPQSFAALCGSSFGSGQGWRERTAESMMVRGLYFTSLVDLGWLEQLFCKTVNEGLFFEG